MHTPPRILIVDDQPTNVHILLTRLKLEGYEVLTATDGAGAIDIAKSHQPDLILLDVIMPDLDGFEVCRRLKADSTLPYMPILMITAKSQPEDIVAGFEAGTDDYLTKPLDRNVLVARVAALLRSKARQDADHDKRIQFEQQAAQWKAWCQTLEDQIQDHILDLKRMGGLKRFLSPEVVEKVVALEDEDIWIGGRKEVTVLSCVLHGFKVFVERTDPKGVFEMLRDYHQTLEPLLKEFDGILERFESDELQIMFNALACHNPVEQAVRMALSMREQLVSRCEGWFSSHYGLDVGIGVAHGEVTLGLMALESRLDYAMISAVPHLASRLGEQAQAATVLISQSVWEKVEKQFHAELAGQLVSSGYADPIPFFEVNSEVENPL